jgi:RimJ/RimL family protein N-acetyltransferase
MKRMTAAPPPTLQTERLTLRPITDDDLDALHAMLSDPEVMRYWSSLPHTELQQTRDWIAENRAGMAAGTSIEYGAVYQGKLIGRGTFWNGNEIGYLFDRAFWGQGFASEAMTAMIDFAFSCRDWVDIIADIDPRNEGSLKLLQRLGFERSGFKAKTFCIGGEWSDSLYLTLKKADWLRRKIETVRH